MKYLRVYECPTHNLRSATIEPADGNGGIRVLGGKCCIRQYAKRIADFPLTPGRLRELIEELERANEEMPG